MAITRANFSELLEPGLKAIYGDTYKEFPEFYSRYMSVENSKKASEHSLMVTGYGLVPEKPEGQSVAYETNQQGWKRTVDNVTYGLGFIVTREAKEDDQYGKINKGPKALAKSVRSTIETLGANIPNRAFSGSYLGGDGKSLCATDHPLLFGGTWQNEPTTAADLSATALEQAYIDITGFVDDRQKKVAAKGKLLMVPPALAWTAQRLLKSTLDPESANNAINPANGMMPYLVNPYLTDPDAWFIITDCMDGLKFYWRRRPEFTRDNDSDTENAKFKTTFRCVPTWDDPRGIYGSPGA